MKRLLAVLLLSPLVVTAQQERMPKPDDFAYGMPLEVDGDGALYSFDLPTEVCRYSTRHDLGDLRIFNGYGEVVPHLLRVANNAPEPEPTPLDLPFFPIMETPDDGKGSTQINIATDESGAVINLWQRGAEAQGNVIGRYLIDASVLQQPLSKLLLDWDGAGEGFVVPVTLESSNDLSNWHQLPVDSALAALSQGGYHLRQSEIELPPHSQAKYYRLAWPLGDKGIKLNSLRAVPASPKTELPRRWQHYAPTGEGDHPGEYTFHVAGHFSFDRARVKLPQSNTVVRARLLSRSALPKSPWQERFHGLLYHLLRDGQMLSSDAIKLRDIDVPDWKLVIETDGGGLGEGMPLLELGWLPPRVYFVARGEGPFILAFASATVDKSSSDISSLLNTLQQSRQGEGFIKSATTGSIYELGGVYRLQQEPPTWPWRQWLLWATLTFGVLIVAMMARSLYRQLDDKNRTE